MSYMWYMILKNLTLITPNRNPPLTRCHILRSQFTYYLITLEGVGGQAMIILIMQQEGV